MNDGVLGEQTVDPFITQAVHSIRTSRQSYARFSGLGNVEDLVDLYRMATYEWQIDIGIRKKTMQFSKPSNEGMRFPTDTRMFRGQMEVFEDARLLIDKLSSFVQLGMRTGNMNEEDNSDTIARIDLPNDCRISQGDDCTDKQIHDGSISGRKRLNKNFQIRARKQRPLTRDV